MRLLHTFAVLGGDARQHYLAELLTASGFTVHTFAVPELPRHCRVAWKRSVSQADAVCLSTARRHLRCDHRSLRPHTRAPFEPPAGALPSSLAAASAPLKRSCKRRTHPIMIILQNSALATQNASLTAEGALLLALQAMPIAIRDSAVLVTGFGRIGKSLAAKASRARRTCHAHHAQPGKLPRHRAALLHPRRNWPLPRRPIAIRRDLQHRPRAHLLS